MDKYLLEILKDSNTIIIPGLGALTITNKVTGETMFMPYLQHDDGKLAKFIAENDGIDEADAKNMVAKYVREIKAELDKGESYSMFKLGTFVKKDDGDIEFKGWTKSAANADETVAAAPINMEETVIADEPTVDDVPEPEPEPLIETEPEVVPEPIIEPEAISEPEPEVIPEPVVETEPEVVPEPVVETQAVSEPEPEVIPEPVVETEPVVEIEPEIIPEPVVEPEVVSEPEPEVIPEPVVEIEPEIVPEAVVTPEPIEVPKEEIEIRETIVEAINSAPEVDDMIPEKTTLEPSALLDDIAPTAAVALDPEIDSSIEGDGDAESEEEEEEKKKAGVGFWITIIVIALAIIAGGAYVGRNYNDIKQKIPFLADKDEKAEKNSLKDEMSNQIKEDKYSKPERYTGEEGENNGEEGFMDEGQGEGIDEVSSETIEVQTPPEPEVKTPEVKTPTPVNVSSSGGPFKVIAGAFSSEANAKKLAAEFTAKGMNGEVFLKGELHAVSMNSYATSEEANASLPKLKSIAPGAWIYYKK